MIPPHTPQTPACGLETRHDPPSDYTSGQGALTGCSYCYVTSNWTYSYLHEPKQSVRVVVEQYETQIGQLTVGQAVGYSCMVMLSGFLILSWTPISFSQEKLPSSSSLFLSFSPSSHA